MTAAATVRTIDLSVQPPSRQTVINGTAITAPVPTSYGFAVPTDGKTICAAGRSGTLLWQRSTGTDTPRFITVTAGDFLLSVTTGSRLNFINPGGLVLWSVSCPFQITGPAVTGFDDRIFVRGTSGLACYGINGIRRWNVTTEETSPVALQQLNDGSLLLFLSTVRNGKSAALRYSPFGALLETITFSGIVQSAYSSIDGVLVILDNGSCGLCSVQDGTAVSVWLTADAAVPADFPPLICSADSGTSVFIISHNKNELLLTTLNRKDGTILKKYTAGQRVLSASSMLSAASSGYFFSDTTLAQAYTLDGDLKWQAKLPDQSLWNFLSYSDGNELIICMKNWVIQTYRMEQTTGEQDTPVQPARTRSFTPQNQSLQPVPDTSLIEKIRQKLTTGDYGADEQQWYTILKTETTRYRNKLTTSPSIARIEKQSYFDSDQLYTVNLIDTIGTYGTGAFTDAISLLLNAESNESLRAALITAAGTTGFDPDGKLLTALQVVLYKIPAGGHAEQAAICDAVYSICRSMGRPALYTKGRYMLSYLLLPQFDMMTQSYARATLAKIMKLEL